jgi:hypothetical protein
MPDSIAQFLAHRWDLRMFSKWKNEVCWGKMGRPAYLLLQITSVKQARVTHLAPGPPGLSTCINSIMLKTANIQNEIYIKKRTVPCHMLPTGKFQLHGTVYDCWWELSGFSPQPELGACFQGVIKGEGASHSSHGPPAAGFWLFYLDLWVVCPSLEADSLLFCLGTDKDTMLQSKRSLLTGARHRCSLAVSARERTRSSF